MVVPNIEERERGGIVGRKFYGRWLRSTSKKTGYPKNSVRQRDCSSQSAWDNDALHALQSVIDVGARKLRD